MILLVATALAISAGLLTGGRLSASASLPIRHSHFIIMVFLVQAIAIEVLIGTPARFVHLLSYAAALTWAWANRHVTGLPVIALGVASNGLVIAANGGVMPATAAAANMAGLSPETGFSNSAVTENATLWWLGDIFATPASWPLSNVFSIGDIALVIGLFLLIRRAGQPASQGGSRLRRAAVAVTGLPSRPGTTAIGVIGLLTVTGTLALLMVTSTMPTGSLVTAGALTTIGLAAHVASIAGPRRQSPTNAFFVLAAVTSPAGGPPMVLAAMIIGEVVHRTIGTGPTSGPARLHVFKTVCNAALNTLAPVGVAVVILTTIGTDPATPAMWAAVTVGSVLIDYVTAVVVHHLIRFATGEPWSPTLLRPSLHPMALVVAAAPATVVCILAAYHPVAVLSLALPMLGWAITADKLARHTEAVTADNISGLPSRPAFLDQTHGIATARAVHVLRIADLREIEQALGPYAADDIIRQVGQHLTELAIGQPQGHVARDCFAVCIDDTGPSAETLGRSLSGTYRVDDLPLPVSIVVGTAARTDRGVQIGVADLLVRAETALDHGTGPVRSFTDKMPLGTAKDLRLADQLRHALGNGEIVPWYQPIMSAGPEPAMVGAEALARWNHPTDGTLPPGAWLPKLVSMGLDSFLTGAMLQAVCADIARWRDEHDAAVHVNLNVTAVDLASGTLPDLVTGACEAHDIDPSWLTIEITEQSAMVDPEATAETLQTLHELGCRIAIDDVGEGHSSLGRLARFDIDELKIDRQMLIGAHGSPRVVAVLDALIGLGHALDMRVVAEGVESMRDARLLTRLGADKLQGYGLGKPADAHTFITEALSHGETMPATAPDTAEAAIGD
ncbi:diguanylate cyclase/phosphodiesterase (GGDEF & EAL domains) with PAS/PAC sensor(s) (plasmid) [Euzebya pacifica]|uniref:Diguanylate cyclase/phosphodiesterase (GGDEF & EAL domains) with PAS/PAC sensor(S) n=1 Tax=Euzebya pacifica TaxID=1608957 RepID=A0A346Y5P8_9ACTN|nr:EAL domain-containing protein [Euzebya pacifica]AXV09795.1 diguanylate cyclase/phosphodiesterase (GGDEF & EAL domains) with PAS/PAC sensor(s) [Euzebya pacifica]